jgi:hypothetical protein
MELEENYNKDFASCKGTSVGYSVEARSRSGPYVDGDLVIGTDWTRIQFQTSDTGVPTPGGWDSSGQLQNHGLFSFSSAQALRWWLHSEIDSGEYVTVPFFSIVTRLVKHCVNYEYTIEAVSYDDVVDNSHGGK